MDIWEQFDPIQMEKPLKPLTNVYYREMISFKMTTLLSEILISSKMSAHSVCFISCFLLKAKTSGLDFLTRPTRRQPAHHLKRVVRALQWRIGIMSVSLSVSDWEKVFQGGTSGLLSALWVVPSLLSHHPKLQSQPHMAPAEENRSPLLSWFPVMPWMSLDILMREGRIQIFLFIFFHCFLLGFHGIIMWIGEWYKDIRDCFVIL